MNFLSIGGGHLKLGGCLQLLARLAPGALKEIIVGPADQGNATRFANECLRWRPNSENLAIIRSSAPYKAF